MINPFCGTIASGAPNSDNYEWAIPHPPSYPRNDSVIIRNELDRLGENTVDTVLGLMLQVDYMHRQGVLTINDHALLIDWLDEASGHIPQAVQQAEVFTLYEGDIDLDGTRQW